MKEYQAISCTYYDYIEHYGVLKKIVTIQYLNDLDEKSLDYLERSICLKNLKYLEIKNNGFSSKEIERLKKSPNLPSLIRVDS